MCGPLRSRARLSVHGGVVQLDFAAGALFGGVDHASVEGAGVDVQADRALIELAGIEDTMDRLERVDGAGVRGVHLDGFRGFDGGFAESDVLMHDVKILHQQAADGDSHPTVLVAVVVDGTDLSDFPADGNQLVENSFVDQVAGVVLAVPGEVRRQRVGVDRGVLQEFAELLGFVEGGFGRTCGVR